MPRAIIIAILLILSTIGVEGQVDYSNDIAAVYFMTRPGELIVGGGRFYIFKKDSLFVWNQKGWNSNSKPIYDTTYYPLTDKEGDSLFRIIHSSDTLKSAVNSCILDGLILEISYKSFTGIHTVGILNAYDDKLFMFVDMINRHVPENLTIHYNKKELEREAEECSQRFPKRTKN